MVLDEPNANLDPEGEQALARALQNAKIQSSTIIIVAQRPSAIQNVDLLMVLRDGQVDTVGPRDEVLAKITTPPRPAAVQGASNVAALTQNRTNPT